MCVFILVSSVLFHWSSCLFLCQYHGVFIAMALLYCLKLGTVILPVEAT
jgi:hypothetical protein